MNFHEFPFQLPQMFSIKIYSVSSSASIGSSSCQENPHDSFLRCPIYPQGFAKNRVWICMDQSSWYAHTCTHFPSCHCLTGVWFLLLQDWSTRKGKDPRARHIPKSCFLILIHEAIRLSICIPDVLERLVDLSHVVFLIYFWGIWHAFPCQVRPGIMCLITCFEWSPPWHICWDILWRSIWHSTWHSMWHVFRHSIWHFLCNFIWHVFWPFISFYLTVSDIYFNLFWHSISHSVVIWHFDPLANSPHWPGCSNFKGDPVYPWKRPSVAIYKFEALANTYIINPKKSKPASNPSIYSRPATLQNWDTQVVWKTALAPNRPL